MTRPPAPIHALPVDPSPDCRASSTCPCRPLAYVDFSTRGVVFVHVHANEPRPVPPASVRLFGDETNGVTTDTTRGMRMTHDRGRGGRDRYSMASSKDRFTASKTWPPPFPDTLFRGFGRE